MQYGASQDVRVVRRYYTGTNALRAGQILNFDTGANQTDDPVNTRLGNAVKDLDSTDIKAFAGIVSESSAGRQGPCFVECYLPQVGDVVLAEVDGTTDVAAKDFLKPDASTGALIKDGSAAAGDVIFLALAVQAADSKVVIPVLKL